MRRKWIVAFSISWLFASTCVGQVTKADLQAAAAERAAKREAALQKSDGAKISPLVSAHGTVVDENGKGIKDVEVHLREWPSERMSELRREAPDSDDRRERQHRFIFATVKTDESGAFIFDQIKSPAFRYSKDSQSRWMVVATAEGKDISWHKLSAAGENKPISLVLKPQRQLKGHVVDSDGKPVAGVKVYTVAIDEPGSQLRGLFHSQLTLDLWESDFSPKCITDKDGRFVINNLPRDRRFILDTRHNDYIRSRVFAATTETEQPPVTDLVFRDGESQSVEQPVQTGEVKIVVERGHRLTGRVVFAGTGKPAIDVPGSMSMLTTNARIYFRTDEDGRFTTRLFDGSDVIVSFSGPLDSDFVRTHANVKFADNVQQKEIDLALERGSRIRGALNAEDGRPIENAGIMFIPDEQLFPKRDLLKIQTKTDSEGQFELLAPANSAGTLIAYTNDDTTSYELPSIYAVMAAAQTESGKKFEPSVAIRTKPAGETLNEIKLVAKYLPALVKGVVIEGNGKPVDCALFTIVDGEGQLGRVRWEPLKRKRYTKSDDEGQFVIYGLAPDQKPTFKVTDELQEWVGYFVVDDDVDRSKMLTVQLERASRINGRVLLDGEPMINKQVHLRIDWRDKVQIDESVTTNDRGEYKFVGVSPDRSCEVVVIRSEGDEIRDEGVSPSSGEEKEVTVFKFLSLNSHVAGVVIDQQGKPVPNVSISVKDAQTDREYRKHFAELRGPIRTDAEGKFDLQFLPEGRKLVLSAQPPQDEKKPRRRTTEKEVDSGTTDIELMLDPDLERDRD